ncbi:probable methyltransferase PMT14 [Neltuma alba]|uniref:probable methyltransferase PMT14 n=1 Tax=Neltuma alba TaxID=207710 RepID=UPI0010A56DED|nr:probable methyltransferase PMT14 [Prosopis alba]XP_028762443.1 probable methyltransferase PMT14 [Prosopis alba]
MGSKNKSLSGHRRSCSIFYVIGLCGLFYLFGAWQKGGSGKGDRIAMDVNRITECEILPHLRFESHHNDKGIYEPEAKVFEPCDVRFTDYTPCYEQDRAMRYPTENMIHKERHCPSHEEKLNCLIPAPKGYMTPFPWPKSRDIVYHANVHSKSLTEEKANQNRVLLQGNVLRFPSRGAMFPQGVDAYIDELASVIPIANGSIRTALDIGCGVASWGAYMLKRYVITMSFGRKDNQEAQVQLALERGVPAVIGVLGTIHLPYPSVAFDMAHCLRCLIPWTSNSGMYLMEVDRVLRPGGYWILSGPPINWKTHHSSWKQSAEELEAEQKKIEELTESLCWEKKYEKGDIAIWRKRLNPEPCRSHSANLCINSDNADDVWYKKMEACKTPFSEANREGEADGEKLKEFPARLFAAPPRISRGSVQGVTAESYQKDNKLWRKHVNTYKRINKLIGTNRYRNVMDMNAGLGGFAAALESPNSWVMNVVPTIAKNTLGAIYERGLIGIYHDWCEGFSTYPRTYDLIHAHGLFSLYHDKCSMEDILLEMDRILRPEGAVIVRDQADVVNKVRKNVRGMRWEAKMVDHEDGPIVPHKILIAVKQYWVGNNGNFTTSRE